uniref:Uncharacterized protein LOC114335662 n=1 Tax=Diabrotica virgifera virgifera TaxID=50390 RepID=A0A6P7FYR8_DIAVI
MDLELLINAVREQKLLWNKKHKDYRNRLLARRAWKRVADGLGCTSADAQKKWKNLRDSFARELKKIPKRRSGADAENGGGEYRGDWPYFEAMKFLEVVIKPRASATSVPRIFLDETDMLDDDTIMSVLSDSTVVSGNTDTIKKIKLKHNMKMTAIRWFHGILF